MASPNSYKDPYWSELAYKAATKVGADPDLLVSIIRNGERSNADQVSEAGAKTVFQITDNTAKLIEKKYGINPFLSDENAAEGAALLLKESSERNKGDKYAIAGEYHGGTDRANWGPRTKAYIQRVVGEKANSTPEAISDEKKSTFQKSLESRKQESEQHSNSIASVLQAYQSGKMAPEDAKQFEEDVNSGLVMLPRGQSLAGDTKRAEPPGAMELPQGVIAAYQNGSMPAEDMKQLDQDVADGLVTLPAGVKLQNINDLGILGGIKEAVTGDLRSTEATRTLPEWTGMPELNEFSTNSAKTALGTMAASPDEIVQIIKANYPETRVRQDEKGNYILTSKDGSDYAIPPGLSVGDIPRILGTVAAFTPAGGAVSNLGMTGAKGLAAAAGTSGAGTALTQAAIEGSQAATGGDFSGKDVLTAGVAGALLPPAVKGVEAVGNAIASPAKALISRAAGGAAKEAESAAPVVNAVVPESVPVAPAVAPTVEETATTALKASEGVLGKKKAMEDLAESVAPDKELLASADRIGVREYLQPDHYTTNQAFREVAQAAKSIVGSEGRAAELKGLEEVAKKADDIVTKLGATDDLSSLSQKSKETLQSAQSKLDDEAEKLFKDLEKGIGATTKVNPTNVINFVRQQAEALGGAKNLSPIEKNILAKLEKKPNYALLDRVRKDVGSAARMAGQFKDADTGLAKKLYSLLLQDQQVAAEAKGMGKVFSEANLAVKLRKGIEKDLTALFGKNLDGNIVSKLTSATGNLAKGDITKFVNLVKSVPEDMRQEVVASGLKTAMGKNSSINFNTYANWYEGLARNKQAYTAVMSNLPKEAQQNLKDLYIVSNGIAKASKERITTGRIQNAAEMFKSAETLAGKAYDAAKHNAAAYVAGGAASVVHPAMGVIIANALSKGAKTPAIAAVDKLLASPQFKETVIMFASGEKKEAARKLAKSVVFVDFIKKAKLTELDTLSEKERWIIQALEAETANRQPPKAAQNK